MENSTINISINLSDLIIEDEESLGLSFSKVLKDSLIYEAQNKVRSLVKDKLDQLILTEITGKLEILIPAMIQANLEKIHMTEVFKNQYGHDTTLDQMIINKFQNTTFDRRLNEFVDSASEKYCKKLKETYDSRFAAGIVEGLNKHNLLNSDAAKLLINN